MNAWVVADSGLLIASVLLETHTPKAKAILQHWMDGKIRIAAPILFRYEIVAVMRKSVYRGMVTVEEAAKGRDFLFAYSVHFMIDSDLLKRAYELATQFNRPTAYDSQYLAVAERLGCEFWTADEKLYNVAGKDLTWVKWLGNFAA